MINHYSLEIHKLSDNINSRRVKQDRRNEMLTQIDMENKVKQLNKDSNNKEMMHMLKHEFDMLDINQVRHQLKMQEVAQRNDNIMRHTKPGFFRDKSQESQQDQALNSSLITHFRRGKDMSEDQRKQKNKEILDIYKQQIQDNQTKKRYHSNHKRLVERVLIEKQTEIDTQKAYIMFPY